MLAVGAAFATTALAASFDFFEPASSPEAAGDTPQGVAAADLDGDGDQDLAVANLFSDNVTILKNNGSGNLRETASSPIATGDAPAKVAAVDLDGDGDQDLAVVNQSNTVTILRNNGHARFRERASSPEKAGVGSDAIVAADLDGDTDQDLAVANFNSGNVTILLNNGSGNFSRSASSPEPAGDGPASIVAADLDGDGDPDLAVANQGSDDVTVLKNKGNGDFFEPVSSPEPAGDGPTSMVASDLDGDGDQDLAIADINVNEVTILKNKGTGNFRQPASSPEPVRAIGLFSIVAAPFDADSDQDLAVAGLVGNPGKVSILGNKGNANFHEPASSPELAGGGPHGLAAADLDGDLDQDLAVANASTNNVTILKNR
jgi:VCBS repeat protein